MGESCATEDAALERFVPEAGPPPKGGLPSSTDGD